MRIKLSRATLDSAKPGAQRYLLRDTRTVGLALKIEPSGTRTFVFEYRLQGKPSQRYNIGRYGQPWTLDQARAEAGRLRSLVDRGLDPLAVRQREASSGRSLTELAALVMAQLERSGRRPGTLYIYRRMLRLFILPRFGRLRVEDLSVEHVERMHAELERTPVQANHALVVLGRCLTIAERWGWIPRGSNPVRWVERYPGRRRGDKKGVMLTPEQMARLLAAFDEEEQSGGDPLAVAALRIAFWTGWRTKSEVLRLQWSDLDLDRSQARLVGTKTADQEYRVLPDEAAAVLRSLPRVEGSPWVFPSQDPMRHRRTLRRVWYRARQRAGLVDLEELGCFRLHDLRHNMVSWDVSRGTSLKMAGASVGHKNQRSTEVYAHFLPSHLLASTNARSQAMREALEAAQQAASGPEEM